MQIKSQPLANKILGLANKNSFAGGDFTLPTWNKNYPLISVLPMKPPFFWVRRTRLNGIISPPYPEATLDNFGFPVGGHLAARRVVFRPPGRILTFFGIFGHFWYPHVALSGGLNGSNIPPWMCSVMFNQFWGLVQPICGHCTMRYGLKRSGNRKMSTSPLILSGYVTFTF